jgi:hypothetical protein
VEFGPGRCGWPLLKDLMRLPTCFPNLHPQGRKGYKQDRGLRGFCGSQYGYTAWMIFAGLWVTLVIFGVANSFSVFFRPLAHEFGWDRVLISLAYSL